MMHKNVFASNLENSTFGHTVIRQSGHLTFASNLEESKFLSSNHPLLFSSKWNERNSKEKKAPS